MTRYRIDRVKADLREEQSARWTFARDPVAGTQYSYNVTDRNLSNRNRWIFTVRVPDSGDDGIEVRPSQVPNFKAWSALRDRSLIFNRATRRGYRGRLYCQVALADVEGPQTKKVASRGQRNELPPWFKQLRRRMRLKKTVRSTRGTDSNAQVLLIRPGDHEMMIRIYFATKVWTLRKGRGL